MEVYYGENFWGSLENHTPMKKIELNQEFIWEDIKGFIPAIYTCEEGFVIDFCVQISDEKIQTFIDKWKTKFGKSIEEEEQLQLIEENPMNLDFRTDISINGQKLEDTFGCQTSYSKQLLNAYKEAYIEQAQEVEAEKPEKEIKSPLEEQLVKEYHCDENSSWGFYRHTCSWEKMPERIESLEIDLIVENKSYPAKTFETDLHCKGKKYEIISPIDDMKYELTILDIKQGEMDMEHLNSLNERENQVEYPNQYLTMNYEITPKVSDVTSEEILEVISEKYFRLQDMGRSDEPRRICQSEQGAFGITIICSASGPTSVFIAGKKSESQKIDKNIISSLHFEPVTSVTWTPIFLKKEREDKKITINIETFSL